MRRQAGGAIVALAFLAGVSSPSSATAAARVARMSPSSRDVSARAGDESWQRMSFVAAGPALPTVPLDVFFLVDTSPWRDEAAFVAARDGLVDGARKLATRRGIRIGVGEYRDLGDVDAEGQATYRLRRRVARPDAALYQTLAALHTGGVDHPLGEAATIAVDQAVHGDGHLVVPPGQAGFDDASHDRDAVIVVVTDSPIANVFTPEPNVNAAATVVYPDVNDTSSDAQFEADTVALLPWMGSAPRDAIDDAAALTSWDPESWRSLPCAGPEQGNLAYDDNLVCAPQLDAADPAGSRRRVASLVPALIDSRAAWTPLDRGLPKDLLGRTGPDGHWTDYFFDIHPYRTDPARPFRFAVQLGLRCPKGTAGKTYTIPLGISRLARNARSSNPHLATVRLHCR